VIDSFGDDIASMISDECFEYLDDPVKRSTLIGTTIPFAGELEDKFLERSRFYHRLKNC
tara:strand:- start:1023 stop:1199 length:177 start_codon:yes stop_codon:yes gene_type:complete